MSRRPARTAFGLVADERGAIALIGLFMAVFLVAVVYYVAGIGSAVLYRERMQDAADTAAFSAAVLHARGMNLIALVNMTMAALLAILVALKVVETLTTIAIALLAVLSAFGSPALAATIPPLTQLRTTVRTLHDQLRPPIHEMLATLHTANRAIRNVVPLASAARGALVARGYESSPARLTVVLPARSALPTQDGTFPELCGQAGAYVGDLTAFVLGDALEPVSDAVSGALSELTRAGASWFCDEGPAPQPPPTKYKVEHPVLPSARACEAMADQPDYDPQRHRELCAQADRDRAASHPDPFGHCTGGCDRELYELRSQLAREACAPRDPPAKLRKFVWQERQFERRYRFVRGDFRVVSTVEEEAATARFTLERRNAPPCGFERARVGREWNRALRTADGESIVPLCSDAAPPAHGRASEGDERVLQHREVVHLFGCTESIERRFELDERARNDRVGGEGGRTRVPQVLLDGALLGDDAFQVRAVVLGERPPGAPRRVVETAAWGRLQLRPEISAMLGSALGRVSFAQAEFFHDVRPAGSYARSSLLWSMRWKARLRRFRLPESESGPADSELLATDALFAPIKAACRGLAQAARDLDPELEVATCDDIDRAVHLIVH